MPTTATVLPSSGPLEAENDSLKDTVKGLRQYIRTIEALGSAADDVATDSEVLDVVEKAIGALRIAVDAGDGSLLVKDEENHALVFVLVQGDALPGELLWRKVPIGYGVVSWVAKHRKPAIVNNSMWDSRIWPQIDQELEFETDSVLAAPVICEDRVLGVIELLNKRHGQHFSVADQALLTFACHLTGKLLGPIQSRSSLENTRH